MATIEKIIGWVWFGEIGIILKEKERTGIILKESEGDESLRAYIGTSRSKNEEISVIEVASKGIPFPIEEAHSIIKKLGSFNSKFYDKEKFVQLIKSI